MTALTRRYVVPLLLDQARKGALAGWMRRTLKRRTLPRTAMPHHIPPWINPAFARRVDLRGIIDAYTDVVTPPLRGPLRRRRYQWLFMPMHLRWAVTHERRVAGFGMEAVDAWSDRRIAEFCLAIPQQALDQPFTYDKRLVRLALQTVMPEPFIRNSGKILPTPLYEGTLRGPAANAVRTLLEGSRAEARGWLDASVLRHEYQRFLAGGPPPDELWWALSLEWWLRVREQR